LERLVYPMINEGARLLEEGIVERASDIDVVWQYGYGWPAWKGGPMFHADRIGVATVRDRLRALADAHGVFFQPALLLEQMARNGARFCA
jgi:3-hydroxyacyl-CoA dehydrogenase